MRKKIFIGFIVMGVALFALKWSLASETGGPRIQFDTLEHDFGHVEEVDILECAFDFKNVGDAELIIERVVSSCGCTVSQVSLTHLKPGEVGQITAKINLSGKKGFIKKRISVFSNDNKNPRVILSIAVNIIHHRTGDKTIFDPECSSCHVEPGRDKLGGELYHAICAYCHGHGEDGKSALGLLEMGVKEKRYIERAIADGIPGSPMPGFSRKRGGPLSKEQITSLVEYIETFGR